MHIYALLQSQRGASRVRPSTVASRSDHLGNTHLRHLSAQAQDHDDTVTFSEWKILGGWENEMKGVFSTFSGPRSQTGPPSHAGWLPLLRACSSTGCYQAKSINIKCYPFIVSAQYPDHVLLEKEKTNDRPPVSTPPPECSIYSSYFALHRKT